MEKYNSRWGQEPSNFSDKEFQSRKFRGIWQKHFINKFIDQSFIRGQEFAYSLCAEDKNEHLPEYLFKFCRPNVNSLINLESDRLWLSSPESFNDPFDCSVGINEESFHRIMIAAELKSSKIKITNEVRANTISQSEYYRIRYAPNRNQANQLSYYQSLSSLLYKIRSEKNRTIQDQLYSIEAKARRSCQKKLELLRKPKFRVACFANFEDDEELGNNTTMWSHYAADHTGFCIKYKITNKNFDGLDEIKCGLFPVKYSNQRPQVPTTFLHKAAIGNSGELEVSKQLTKAFYKALIYKSAIWNYEKEWRLILGNSSKLIANGNIEFPFVDAVYLGCRMEKSLKEHLTVLAKSKDIKVFEGRQDQKLFTISFYQIS